MFMMQFGNTIKIFESQDFLHKYSRITQCQSHSFLNWNMEVYGTTLDMHTQTVKVSTLAYDLSCFKCKARRVFVPLKHFDQYQNTNKSPTFEEI